MTLNIWIDEFQKILGQQWAEQIPAAVDRVLRLANEWQVTPQKTVPGATCSLVLLAKDESGQQVVLRLPLAEEERTCGFDAMKAFTNHGGVQIYQEDEETGATLMPYLSGPNLANSNLSDEAQIAVATELFLNLQQATSPNSPNSPRSPHSPDAGCPLPAARFWSHERWFQEMWDYTAPPDPKIDPKLIEYGKKLGRYMLDTTDHQTLLHGDLHHFNILEHEGKWFAIDPKGVIGDPAFEPVAFLRNPIPEIAQDPNINKRQRRRIETFAEGLNEPIERIWGWAVAQIVLDAAWSEGQMSGDWKVVAESLLAIRPKEAANLP